MSLHDDELFPWEKPEHRPALDAGASALAPSPQPLVRTPSPDPVGRGERRDDRGSAQRAAAVVTDPVARERHVAKKEYYAISEVCDIVGLKPHVLRYWETQFGPLNPSKNRSGNRVYQRKEIKLILLVKHLLYEEKYTVEGARAKLDQLRRTGRLTEMTGRAMTAETATMVRDELKHLLGVLVPAEDRA
jgi:DNA-binding transcriptional MerR regulator